MLEVEQRLADQCHITVRELTRPAADVFFNVIDLIIYGIRPGERIQIWVPVEHWRDERTDDYHTGKLEHLYDYLFNSYIRPDVFSVAHWHPRSDVHEQLVVDVCYFTTGVLR
jgi:hypothetical protein